MAWLKLTTKALYLMEGDEYLENVELSLIRTNPEQYKMDLPLEWLQEANAPGKMIISLDKSSVEPTKKTIKSPPIPTRRQIKITKTGRRRPDGLEVLNVTLMNGNTQIDQIEAVAGAPGRQSFRLPSASQAGSSEPLPEGYWDLGEPEPNPMNHSRSSISKLVEFASGVTNDYSKDWPISGDGLGPVWVSMYCRSRTARSVIGFHIDNNSLNSPGTDGCIGIINDSGLKSLKKFASWFDDKKDAPHVAIVDWELGSI
jgi:lysozyme